MFCLFPFLTFYLVMNSCYSNRYAGDNNMKNVGHLKYFFLNMQYLHKQSPDSKNMLLRTLNTKTKIIQTLPLLTPPQKLTHLPKVKTVLVEQPLALPRYANNKKTYWPKRVQPKILLSLPLPLYLSLSLSLPK